MCQREAHIYLILYKIKHKSQGPTMKNEKLKSEGV
jgi:hypothetical protein